MKTPKQINPTVRYFVSIFLFIFLWPNIGNYSTV